MTHPDEAVTPQDEVKSTLVSEAVARHEFAKTDAATAQEKKQADVEQAHALSTRPDGSYAQLHEGEPPTVAVADPAEVKQLKKEQAEAVAKVEGKSDAAPAEKAAAEAPKHGVVPVEGRRP